MRPAARACGWLAGLIAAACMAGPALGAEEQQYGDVLVRLVASPEKWSAHGYGEYRLEVENLSASAAHRVELRLPATAYGGSSLREVRRTLQLAPGATAGVSLWQPALPLSGYGLGVRVDGEEQEPPLTIAGGMRSARGEKAGEVFLLVSQRLGSSFLVPVQSDALHYEEGPAERWSASWLGYSRYDGVVLGAQELDGLAPPVRDALLRWVECGGTLVVLGDWAPPPGWGEAEERDGLRIQHAGFGEVLTSADPDASRFVRHWPRVEEAWQASASVFRGRPDVEQANRLLPIVDDLRFSGGWVFLLMLGLALAIGPVNYLWLARRGRAIAMLATVPALSLTSCVLILTVALLAEGWEGRSRTRSLTILDEAARRATTIAWAAYYAPLTLRGGLRFGLETELTAAVSTRTLRRAGNQRSLDWTRDQHLASGWMPARVPAHFQVRKSERRRERLALREDPQGGFSVTNGLGADARELWLADAQGRLWRASAVPAGAQVRLEPAGGEPGGGRDVLRRVYGTAWLTVFEAMTDAPASFLRAGRYVAVLDGAPFLEPAHPSIGQRDETSLVYGILRGGRDES